MGADIEGDGTDTIVINGVESLRPAQHTIIPDRIEAGTFMIAATITKGDIEIESCRPQHLGALIEKLKSAGAAIKSRHQNHAFSWFSHRSPGPVHVSYVYCKGLEHDQRDRI